jgi:hypothetical protein
MRLSFCVACGAKTNLLHACLVPGVLRLGAWLRPCSGRTEAATAVEASSEQRAPLARLLQKATERASQPTARRQSSVGASGRRGRVDGLLLEIHAEKVDERASTPVDCPSHDHVKTTPLAVLQHPVQSGPRIPHRADRFSAISG